MDTRSRIWKRLNATRREFRLFILEPSRDAKATLRGRLITRSIDQQVRYDAISHAWGRPSFPEVVVIDGIDWLVSTGVFDALQRLRHQIEEKCFWIDALCIDQFDLRERAEQVKYMQYIFNNAVTVQVWLGRHPTTISGLITDMNHPERGRRLFSQTRFPHELQQDFVLTLDLAHLEYFSRTWIYQELALARNINFNFGSTTFTLRQLTDLYHQFENSSRVGDRIERTFIRRTIESIVRTSDLLKIATLGNLEDNAMSLTQVIQRARLSQCHDPRDRIYGFLGILTATLGPDFLEPDYQCSVATAYTDFAIRLVATTGSLAILNQAESICNSTPNLPTFVPDWASRFQQHDALSRLKTYPKYYAAGLDSTSRCRKAASDSPANQLKCNGIVRTMVTSVGECSRSIFGTPDSDMLETVIRSWRVLYNGNDEDFIRCITADRVRPKQVSLQECVDALHRQPGSRAEPNLLRDAIGNATSNRRFFVTATGQAGLGPRDTRKGDYIAVLAGGRVPYVLRPSDYEGNVHFSQLSLFAFVGDCYVQGIMYGEALSQPPTTTWGDIWLE